MSSPAPKPEPAAPASRQPWPPPGGAPGPPEHAPALALRSPLSLRAATACVAVSLLAAALAYAIGHRLPAVYQSSGMIRVATATQSGIADTDVTADNDLASQYAQLVATSPVLTLTAKSLRLPPKDLSGEISGSTIGAQNLLAVTASASTPTAAVARAQAAVYAVALYLSQLTAQFNTSYAVLLQSRIRNTAIPGDTGAKLAPQIAAAFDTARATALFEALRDAAGNQPSFQVISAAGAADQTAPKPKLYALVAVVVAFLLSLRVALTARRRSAPP